MALAAATERFRAEKVGYYGDEVGMGVRPDGPILHWTWRLRDSLSDFNSNGTRFSIRRGMRMKMLYGTSHPLAHLNHRGIDAPRREVLDEAGSLKAVVRLAQKTLVNQMNTAPRGRFRRLR